MIKGNLNKFANDFQSNLKAVKKLFSGDLQRIIAIEGKNHFEQSWDNQGFTDSSLAKWDRRKSPQKKFRKDGKALKSYKKWSSKDKGRAILVSHRSDTKGGHLKDSIRSEIRGTKVIFSTDKPYARVHNEGGKSGRGSGFTMPPRRFMGNSQQLNDKIIDKITREFDKIFKS